MHPDKKPVLPVMPEVIQNSDGRDKQDCESKAAKRFIEKLKKTHPRQQFVIVGDGLMSHQPMIDTLLCHDLHFLLVAKLWDHQYLFEWLNDFASLPTREVLDEQGRTHRYRWQNSMPLHGQANAVDVNYLEYRLINPQGKTTDKNSWVTDFTLSQHNVAKLAQAGRCRWKIENECFNTLKNQGYHIDHNYGHGNQHLSYRKYSEGPFGC